MGNSRAHIMEDVGIVLDPQIRDWVLIPIVTVMFLVGVLRDRVTRLLRSEQKGKVENVQQASVLAKSKMLRMHSGFIPEESFRMRKKFLIDEHLSQGKEKNPMDAMAMMNDPSMFMDMMKKNMVMVVPQMAMMGWVSYFFSGFIVGKMPFPLTDRFKMMLQRGIELSSLDVTYVSSLVTLRRWQVGSRAKHSLFLAGAASTSISQNVSITQSVRRLGRHLRFKSMRPPSDTSKGC